MDKSLIICGIIGVVAILFVAVAFIKRKEIKEFLESDACKDLIKKACIAAEQEIVGTKRGQERLLIVCKAVIDARPDFIAEYLTPDMLVEAINEVFIAISKKMEDGSTKAVEE